MIREYRGVKRQASLPYRSDLSKLEGSYQRIVPPWTSTHEPECAEAGAAYLPARASLRDYPHLRYLVFDKHHWSTHLSDHGTNGRPREAAGYCLRSVRARSLGLPHGRSPWTRALPCRLDC